MSNYTTGCIPSTKDYRDYRYKDYFPVKEALPASFICPTLPPAAWDQGMYPMCVGYSIAMYATITNAVERGRWEEYSPSFAYCNRYPGQYMGPGAQPRDILANFVKDGSCRFATYNKMYSDPQPADITPDMREEARPQRASSYCAVQKVDEIKTAIKQNGPVLYCIPVYYNFYTPLEGVVQDYDYWGGFTGGYHATLAVGWKPGYWRILNSWGIGWGDKGYCWLPWHYPLAEAWAITDYVPKGITIELLIGKDYALINGIKVNLDQPSVIDAKTSRTLVPARFIAESLGCEVSWDSVQRKVTIKKA